MKAAVLDTITLLSGFGWRHAPARKVVNAALAGRFVPVTSPELLAELEATMAQPELRGAIAEPRRVRALVARMSIVVEARPAPKAVVDPHANHLLAVAEAAAADFLVTADIALLQLGRHDATTIVRPR